MSTFALVKIDKDLEDDLRAEARLSMFNALRKAFKHRAEENGVLARDLAEALGKDKGYVSRVLNGSNRTMDFETLYTFLEGLRYHLPLEPIPYEDLEKKRANFDARPTTNVLTASGKGILPITKPDVPSPSAHTESTPGGAKAKSKLISVSTVSL